MRLTVLLAILSACTFDKARASDDKRDSEMILLSPERLDNVGHGNGRPPCPARGCTFSQSKLCWDGINDICTDYYSSGPRPKNVVKYFLEITNVTLTPDGDPRAPDGVTRPYALVINGTIPGPTITANWGDTVEVTVLNSMQDNGTSIHWHGIRQYKNFINDGVNGVTECPIAPGQQKTYTWIAEQYDDWYHSHHTVQYGDGVFGAINILGPATAEYDIDLGPVTLSDWFYNTAYQIMHTDEREGPQTADNFLVQGMNLNLNTSAPPSERGKQFELVFTPGKKHLVRFINTSTQTYFRVALDDHIMTVVQTDFVPVVPYPTNNIGIAIGQRYSVIIEANQANGSYWLRTWPQINACSGNNTNDGTGDASAYVRYEPAPDVQPTSTSYTITDNCDDEFIEGINEPYLHVPIDSTPFHDNHTVMDVSGPFDHRISPTETVNRWRVGWQDTMAGMDVDWGNPGVKQLLQNMTYAHASRSGDVSPGCQQALSALNPQLDSFCIDGDNSTSYWVIQNLFPATHPLHLHNHDFNIVARGKGTYAYIPRNFNWKNPSRRDVTSLPGSGYVVLAFKADNPSISILHCHIAWHVAEGLSLQLVERPTEIPTFTHLSAEWNQTCAAWNDWYPANDYWAPNTDSGLR